jgi:hypothetical protein
MVDLLIDFRSRGWSGSAETVGPWRAIECQTMGASWTRGSGQYRGLLCAPEDGQANLILFDPERDLDPGNTAGIYYGQIDVGCDIRLRFGGRQVFIGRIAQLSHEFDTSVSPTVAIATIQATGYQGKIALISALSLSLDGFNGGWPEENTYARVNRILDGCAVAAADRDIETGGQTILDIDANYARQAGSAWDMLLRTMVAEIGSIEITTAGVVRTRNRNTVWNTTPAATLHLGCCAHAGVIPIHEGSFETLRDTVRNHVKITIEANDVYGPVEDAASQAKYGLRKYDTGIGETTIAFSGGAAWPPYFLARMKSPLRSWRLTMRPLTQAQIDALEGVFLYTSRVHVVIDDVGGDLIDLQLRPVGVEWSVDPDGSVCQMVLGG